MLTSDEVIEAKRQQLDEKEEKKRLKNERDSLGQAKVKAGKKGKGAPRGRGKAIPVPVHTQKSTSCIVFRKTQLHVASDNNADSWVQCDECKLWIHQQCVPLILHPAIQLWLMQ